MAKLSTPQNVSVSGNQLSFNEVTNAQWYSILANGVEIGTYGDVAPDTTNAYRVVFSKPANVTLNVTVNDNPSDPDAGIDYPAQSGWALYDGDQITVYKMGSDQHLEINGVLYNADNTTHTISVTDDDVLIGLEGTGDASGDNYVKVVINFSLSTSYGASKIYLGGNRIGNMYIGSTGLRAAYLGTNKVFGLTDTYNIVSNLTNAYYCTVIGTATSAPTSIDTGGTAIYWLTQPEHYNAPTVTITPLGAVKYTYNADQISRLELSKPRGSFTIAATAIKEYYLVTWTATHCTVNGANTIDYGGTAVYSIDPDQYYELPQTITVTNATGNWDRSTGTLTISNPTGKVSFTATATRIQYTYTENLTNCTKLDGDLSTIYAGQTVTRGFAATAGYAFPTSITVTGATYTWNAGSGELTISNPTGNVTVTIAAVAKTFNYSVSATNCTATPTSGTIKGGASANIGITWNENLFSFGSSNITVTGASHSYSNGTLTISDPTQNVTVTASATRIAYTLTAAGTDCTLSPASGYVKTDGSVTEITVTPNSGYGVTTAEGLTVTGAQHTVAMSGDNLVISLSYATGNVTVAYVAVKKYTITYKLTHLTANPQPTSLLDGYSTTFTLSPTIGWKLPSVVSLTGATVDYNPNTGKVTLSKPQYNITLTAIADAKTYSVTTNVTGCTISGPTTISTDGTATYTLTADSGYELPTQLMVGVVNATKQSYTLNAAKTSATLVITAPSGAVTITVDAVRVSYSVTYNLTNCTADSSNPTTAPVGGSADFKFTASTGYELSATPTVTGATLASWDYPDSTDKSVAVAAIENVTGNVTITVVGSLPKLATPTGLTIDGDTLSFNEVENAETYYVFANGVSIGTYTPPQQLISFTIGGVSYQAEDGMTWQEWVDSSYNTNQKFYIGLYNKVWYETGYVSTGSSDVYAEDIIISGAKYIQLHSGGSAN